MNRKQRRAAAAQKKRAPDQLQRAMSTAAPEILMNSAIRCQQTGRLTEAERLYRQILASDPGHIGSLHNLGLIAHESGRHTEAIGLIEKALSLNEHIPICHNSLGMTLCAVGRFEEAITHYKKALALDPTYAQAHNNLGNALKNQGRMDEAVEQFQRALALNPSLPEAHNNMGNVFRDRGKLDEAVLSYRCALAANPNFADAHYNLGTVLQDQGQFDEAVLHYQRVLACHPEHAEALNNLGNALKHQGKLEEAVAQYQRALALRPGYFLAHHNLAAAFEALGRWDAAIAEYEQALSLHPRELEARLALGNRLKSLGRLDDAVAQYKRALTIDPECVQGYFCLAAAFQDRDELEEAVAQYRQALSRKPDLAEAHNNLANALKAQRKFDEAVDHYRRALSLEPDAPEVHCNLGAVLVDQGHLHAAIAQFERALEVKPDFATAHSNLVFGLLYDDKVSSGELFAAHREWDVRHGGPRRRPQSYANDRSIDRRLKVGYVSADFRQHPVPSFLEPLLAAHNREAVEVFCYAELKRPDLVTQRLQALADHWRVTMGLSDEAVAAQIAADDIDILVDLAGHTANNRLPVFALKPAPVQASWLGYPNFTGLSAIDYRLVDAVTDPVDDGECAASETPFRLDGCFLCYVAPSDAPQPSLHSRAVTDSVTFASFNSPIKYSEATLNAWAELLKRMPAARLLLKGLPFADAATQARYRARLVERGVAPERITLLGRTPDKAGHLAQYREVDVALDPFPYNGTTTTCEALWMGVPVVCLRGNRHSGRVGASLLSAVGLDELIAEDVEGYIDLAVRLAQDRPRLIDLSGSLRTKIAASPLCDAPGFARKMEAAYRSMWRRWCEKSTPDRPAP
jgi:predicted O-linked N-acetylglucosamine transferase (SPINDLY family)